MQPSQPARQTSSQPSSATAPSLLTLPFLMPQRGVHGAATSSSQPTMRTAGNPPTMQALVDGHGWPVQQPSPAAPSRLPPEHGEPAWRRQGASTGLIAAVRAGDLPALAERLADPSARTTINAEDESGKSALDHALEHKAFHAARLLVQHGAKFADDELLNPQLLVDLIHADQLAFAREVAKCRQVLIASLPAAAGEASLGLQSPLTMAVLIGDVELASLLMSPRSFFLCDTSGNTLLHFGVAAVSPRMLSFLLARLPGDSLQRQVILNAHRLDGRTPLIQAVVSNRTTAMAVLLRAGAAIDAADHKGETALHKAARDGLLEAGRLLLAMGARTDFRNLHQQTPAAMARGYGRPDFVELLAACGARE